MDVEILITLAGGVGTSAKWVYEYTKKLKWEKNKFLLEQLELFHSVESTKIMETLLDWNGTKVTIKGKEVFVDDEILLNSLYTHDVKHSFTKLEFELRDVFDEYFDNLSKLIFMSKSGLIDKKNLIMFLEYWLKILSGRMNNKSREMVEQITKYLDFYEFTALRDFISYEIV